MGIVPDDKDENLRRAARWIAQAAEENASLVCLPEYFNCGYLPERLRALAEPVGGPTTEALAHAARTNRIHVVASFPEQGSGDDLHDSAVFVAPDGSLLATYRKNHLYDTENDYFTPGRDSCVLDLPFGTVAVCICFDFCFPDDMDRLRDAGAQLLLHPTAWFYEEFPGQYRRACGKIATDHDMAFLSANITGPLGGLLAGIGQSCILHRGGAVAAEAGSEEDLIVAALDLSA
jgi:predicted amidohydrolase